MAYGSLGKRVGLTPSGFESPYLRQRNDERRRSVAAALFVVPGAVGSTHSADLGGSESPTSAEGTTNGVAAWLRRRSWFRSGLGQRPAQVSPADRGSLDSVGVATPDKSRLCPRSPAATPGDLQGRRNLGLLTARILVRTTEGRVRDGEQFAQFVSERSPALMRAAWLLTGDWHLAEDLVQVALEKSWPRWGRRSSTPRPTCGG